MPNQFCPTLNTGNQQNGKTIYYGKNCVNGTFTGYGSMALQPNLPCNPNVTCGAASCVATLLINLANGATRAIDSDMTPSRQPKRPKHEDAVEVSIDGFSTRIAMSTTAAFPKDLGNPTSEMVYVKLTQLHVDMGANGLGQIAIGWEIVESSHQYRVHPSQVTVISPNACGESNEVAIQVGGVVYSVGTHTAIKKA